LIVLGLLSVISSMDVPFPGAAGFLASGFLGGIGLPLASSLTSAASAAS
jgi:hypothetical protein